MAVGYRMRRLVGGLIAFVALPPAGAEAWTWPVRGPVIGRFAYARANPFAGGQRRGIDIAASRGTPVVAACGGRVRFAGQIGTSGRTVSTACGAYVVSYLHLDRITARRGAQVHAGDPIGTVGTTGRRHEARPHVSFGVRRASDGWGYVDPLRLLPRGRASPPDLAPLPRRRLPRDTPLGPAPAPAHRPAPAPARRSGLIGGAAEVDPDGLWVPAGGVLVLLAAGAPLVTLQVRRARRRPIPRGEAAARPARA